jgi:hypothetical protein
LAQIAVMLLFLSTYVAEVCHFIATAGAAIIVVAVIAWGWVEEESWTLREAIRFVSALAVLLAIIGAVVVAVVTRSG